MAAEYESSVDFTEDMMQAYKLLQDAAKLLQKPEMRAWMAITDQNYCTVTAPLYSNLLINVCDTISAFQALDSELERAV